MPAKYAGRLWKLMHEKSSTVQILISDARFGKKLLERMASTGESRNWSAPKLTAKGDTVLFYVERPASKVMAVGKALSKARPTKRKWYEARVGQVRLLHAPIELTELRRMFPDWAWLRTVNMFAYLSSPRAKAMLKRCALKSSGTAIAKNRAARGGFGEAKANALVEKAAVRKVDKLLKERGFSVRSRERERNGYDLEARKGRTELHVEVKGVSGEEMRFIITEGEVAKAASDSAFRLMVVTQAGTPDARVRDYRGRVLKRIFALTPVSYFAERK